MSKKQSQKKANSSWIKPEPKEPQWIQDFYYSDQQEGQSQTKPAQSHNISDPLIYQQTSQKQPNQQPISSNISEGPQIQQVPCNTDKNLPVANIEQIPQQSIQEQVLKKPVQNLFKSNQQRIIQAIDHLIKTAQNPVLKQKMKVVMKGLQQHKVTIHDAMLQMSSLDVTILNSHRLFILSFEETAYFMLSFQEFRAFRRIDFLELLKNIYNYISEKIDFQNLSKGMKIEMCLRYQTFISADKIESFVDLFFQKNFIVYETKEMQFKRLHNRAMRESRGTVPGNQQAEYESKIKNYDGKSQYDIFKTVYEEGRMGPEGVYKYRLHRTLYFLEKHKFLNPKQNEQTLQKSKDLAVFIIKLTDAHLKKIMKQAALNAKLSGQNKVLPSYKNVCDEVTYFAREKYAPKDKQSGPILRYKYPCVLKKCFKLRGEELWRQDFLYKTLYPQLYITLAHTKKKDHPHQQIINDYFHSAIVTQESKQEYKKYKQPRPKASKIRIQTKHILEVIENHKAYENNLVVFRLKAIF